MTKESDLLQHICQTTEMGQLGIDMVLDYADNASFHDALCKQKTEYADLYQSADSLLRERGEQPKSINAFARFSSELASSMKTMHDHSQSAIAEMMIQGNTKGMTKSLQYLEDYSGEATPITALTRKLLQTEESNIEQMKSFL